MVFGIHPERAMRSRLTKLRMVADIFSQILRTLWAHKLRSFLTMFGIAWGIGSLLLLVGLGEGFRSGNKREMAEFGEDIMFVFPGRAPVVQGSLRSARNYLLTYQDYFDVRNTAPYVREASPVLVRDDVRAVSEFASANGQITGIEPQFNRIRYLPIKQGRWLNDLDEQQKRNVIVLGEEMTRNLFPGRPAMGATILLNGIRFEVIGSVQRVGRGDNNSTNMRGYIPYQVMSMYFPLKGEQQRATISFINYQPRTQAEHLLAAQEVRKVIARNHGFDYRDDNAFEMWDTIQQSEMIGGIFDAMNLFLGGVGMVTLALGAIGVINIMLVSVSERTHEIGLRKAVGATNRNILFQFFLEGILLTLVSGLIGMGLATALMAALGTVQGPEGFDPPKLVPLTAALAIGSLMLAGWPPDSIPPAKPRFCSRSMLSDRSSACCAILSSRLGRRCDTTAAAPALTMLGMAWGIATVVLLLAYGNGFGQAMTNIFASFGTKTMILAPGRTSMQAGGQKAGVALRFTLDDIDLLTTNVPQITRITPEVYKNASIQYDTRAFNFGVVGDRPNVVAIKVLETAQGRFYNLGDQVQRARVAVLGSEAKEKLFSGRNAVGERIRINGLSFEVIGVLLPKMQEGDNDINRIIYVPFTTMGDLTDTHYLGSIWFNYEVNDYQGLERAVRSVMAVQHKFSATDRRALFVFSLMEQVYQFQVITFGLKILLTCIGTLTLGIGGVGVMNIMLVSVTQRTREIGMEKALGSRKRDVFFQFLTEALAISFMGGLLGVMLAYVIAHAVGRLTLYRAIAKHAEAGDIRLLIDPGTLVIATLILGAVALVCGMLPAIRAARLNPIEALRYE